jgi:CDP-diacylglycerol---glycerol-3-phosphate 3-phosphatidyltransferase
MTATLYAIKPRFQAVLRGLADRCIARGISADALTATGLTAAALAGGLIAAAGAPPQPWLALATPLLFVRITCNALDGMVARDTGTARPWGAVLNEVGDRAADLLCFGGLILSGALTPPVALALLPLLLFASYVGVVGQVAGGGRSHAGPLGKADRMLLLGVYCCLAPFVPWAAPALGWALLLGLALTAANRLRAIHHDLAR